MMSDNDYGLDPALRRNVDSLKQVNLRLGERIATLEESLKNSMARGELANQTCEELREKLGSSKARIKAVRFEWNAGASGFDGAVFPVKDVVMTQPCHSVAPNWIYDWTLITLRDGIRLTVHETEFHVLSLLGWNVISRRAKVEIDKVVRP